MGTHSRCDQVCDKLRPLLGGQRGETGWEMDVVPIHVSVDPADRDPLGRRVDVFEGAFQSGYGLVDIIVDDRQIEKVAVRLTEELRFFGQPFEASVKLKNRPIHEFLDKKLNYPPEI